MNHYQSAERLLELSDEKVIEAMLVSDMTKMISAITHLIAAQTHATLAIVDEMRRD